MRVIVREAAYDDLDRIHEWIAKDRPRSADAVIDRILESADRLGHFPHMGHVGRASGTYEWVVPDCLTSSYTKSMLPTIWSP
jgi:plasmid stabilization system protein ParE